MRKLILLPLLILALLPNIKINIPVFNTNLWAWFILLAGFSGMYLCFLKVNIYIKILTVYTFIACFFSAMPYYSFTSYILFVGCIYYYYFCTRLEDWTRVWRVLICIFGLNLLILGMQYIGKDYLCNFGLEAQKNTNFGTMGNPMRLSSMLITIIAFFMASIKPNKYKKQKYIAIIGLIIYLIGQQFIRRKVLLYFPMIRAEVWKETLRLSLERPVFGWGIGTFKDLFHQISILGHNAKVEGIWFQAHNCWLQAWFEAGTAGFLIIVAYITNLYIRLIKSKLFFCVIGLTLFNLNILYHSPTRETQIVLIIACFLAFLERKILCHQN